MLLFIKHNGKAVQIQTKLASTMINNLGKNKKEKDELLVHQSTKSIRTKMYWWDYINSVHFQSASGHQVLLSVSMESVHPSMRNQQLRLDKWQGAQSNQSSEESNHFFIAISMVK